MRLKILHLSTGGPLVAVLDRRTADGMDMHLGDRVCISNGRNKIIAIVDIAHSDDIVSQDQVAIFEEAQVSLQGHSGEHIHVSYEEKPASVQFIQKKLNGSILKESEYKEIMQDIVANRLSDIELTFFVAACYAHPLTMPEVTALTRSMVSTGDNLDLHARKIVDLHSIGGVAGNRTTMIVVPILAAAGLIVPKTASRAITSPSGTADTMEVFSPVSFSIDELKGIISRTGGCIAWGGSLNLAPADDKIIKIEHPLRIDAEGQLLASIMAKKASVGATHLLIEIPFGEGLKVTNINAATELKKKFISLSKRLGIRIYVLLSHTKAPVGYGIGPSLEALDVLKVLRHETDAPMDLRKHSLEMAGILLEMAGKSKNGSRMAQQLLDSGKAFDKFIQIVLAQKGKPDFEKRIQLGKYTAEISSEVTGRVSSIDNTAISKIARIAGAPLDKGAGVLLLKQLGDTVQSGEALYRIYAQNKDKLSFALNLGLNGYQIMALP